MKQSSPADRDRAQRRVRSITVTAAAGAGLLTVAGAAATATTFAGRTVSADQTAASPGTAQTLDPSTGLQPPAQPPTDNSGFGSGNAQPPVVTGGS
ncbi:MAG TPA: hypothetical protein VLO10_01920 [Candidatus Deferrimicrobium sp.]|nr:hypothetical protein [Candidatus Deferrimicrobium sp.]